MALDGSDRVVVPPGQTDYASDPRHGRPATVYVGIQSRKSSLFGRPILDAAFDGDDVYVVPVVVNPEGQDAYLAAAKLRLLPTGNPPYQVTQLFDDPPEPNNNQQRDNLREIEIDDAGNIYVTNVHSLNESDILWKYKSDGTLLNRLDLHEPDGSVCLPDPVAMHASHVTDVVYVASALCGEEPDVAIVHRLSRENLAPVGSVTIHGMHHVTGIAEEPTTGTLWVIGFNTAQSSDSANPTQPPFYYPCLASVPPGYTSAQAVVPSGSSDLGLPMSIVWTGDR